MTINFLHDSFYSNYKVEVEGVMFREVFTGNPNNPGEVRWYLDYTLQTARSHRAFVSRHLGEGMIAHREEFRKMSKTIRLVNQLRKELEIKINIID